MSFNHVVPGQRIKPRASDWNAAMDAARAFRNQRPTGPARRLEVADADQLEFRNDTGVDLERGHVVGLGAPVFTPTDNLADFKNRPILKGESPTSAHAGKFGIVIEPAAETTLYGGRYGTAVLSGVVPVQLNVSANADSNEWQWADVAAGHTDYLELRHSGTARVLWREPGTGVLWAVVRLSNAIAPEGDFPGSVGACSESECAEPVTLDGATVCCKEHKSRSSEIPPFGKVTFNWVSGDVWETGPITIECYEGEDTYILRRTLFFDADGRRKSRIELILDAGGYCETICFTYESCCFIKCPCCQPHKLKDWGGIRFGGSVSALAGEICLCPAVVNDACSDYHFELDVDGVTICDESAYSEETVDVECGTITTCYWKSTTAVDGKFFLLIWTHSDFCTPFWSLTIQDTPIGTSPTNQAVYAGPVTSVYSPRTFTKQSFTGSDIYPATVTVSLRDENSQCQTSIDSSTTSGSCTGDCGDETYGGGGGDSCSGTCTLQWQTGSWTVLGSGCTESGDFCTDETCSCAHPGRDGAFLGETIVTGCTCCGVGDPTCVGV